jgi:hypothetical protein
MQLHETPVGIDIDRAPAERLYRQPADLVVVVRERGRERVRAHRPHRYQRTKRILPHHAIVVVRVDVANDVHEPRGRFRLVADTGHPCVAAGQCLEPMERRPARRRVLLTRRGAIESRIEDVLHRGDVRGIRIRDVADRGKGGPRVRDRGPADRSTNRGRRRRRQVGILPRIDMPQRLGDGGRGGQPDRRGRRIGPGDETRNQGGIFEPSERADRISCLRDVAGLGERDEDVRAGPGALGVEHGHRFLGRLGLDPAARTAGRDLREHAGQAHHNGESHRQPPKTCTRVAANAASRRARSRRP